MSVWVFDEAQNKTGSTRSDDAEYASWGRQQSRRAHGTDFSNSFHKIFSEVLVFLEI